MKTLAFAILALGLALVVLLLSVSAFSPRAQSSEATLQILWKGQVTGYTVNFVRHIPSGDLFLMRSDRLLQVTDAIASAAIISGAPLVVESESVLSGYNTAVVRVQGTNVRFLFRGKDMAMLSAYEGQAR